LKSRESKYEDNTEDECLSREELTGDHIVGEALEKARYSFMVEVFYES